MNLLADYAYTHPFLQPMPVWNYWYLLLLPLCLGVAVVYKAIKCNSMKRVPREALAVTTWILVSFIAAGAALAGLVRLMEHLL